MKDLGSVVVKVRVAWWLPLYINTLKFFCFTFGTFPDEKKLQRTIEYAIRVEV